MRNALGLTQSELAVQSGVSQSTIAKIESKKTEASYLTIVKLFETLDKINRDTGMDRTAADVASGSLITVDAEDSLRIASDLMRKTGFSQMPVMSGESPVGSISERMILGLIDQGMSMEELRKTSIKKVMGESFPVVSEGMSLSTVSQIMGDSNAVLVSRQGKVISMITSADLLKLI